jgi:hypothetical protein
MGKVQVREHVWMNLSRRSLCDNCSAEVCVYNTGERIAHCKDYQPKYVAFKRCNDCGSVFEVSSNFQGLDYDLCPVCNATYNDQSRIMIHP